MLNARRTTATIGAAALLVAPLSVLSAGPATAADREFRYGGAEVEFDVEKDDGRFDVDVDIDDARRGDRFKVVLRHNGKVFHQRTHRADGDGDVADIDKTRPDTRGRDVFKLTVKKVGMTKAAVRTIRR